MGSSTIIPKGYHFGKHEFEGYVWVNNIAGQTKNVSLCSDKSCTVASCATYPTVCGGACVAIVAGPSVWQGKYMKIDCSGPHCGPSGFTEAPAHSLDGDWARRWETKCDLVTDAACQGNVTHTVCMNINGPRGDLSYKASFSKVTVQGQEFNGKIEGFAAIRGLRYDHIVNSKLNRVAYILEKGQWSRQGSFSWFKTANMLPSRSVTYAIPDARTKTLPFKAGEESFDLSRSDICIPPPCVLWEGCINWEKPWSQDWLFVFYFLALFLCLCIFLKWLQLMCREEEQFVMVGGKMLSAAELIQVKQAGSMGKYLAHSQQGNAFDDEEEEEDEEYPDSMPEEERHRRAKIRRAEKELARSQKDLDQMSRSGGTDGGLSAEEKRYRERDMAATRSAQKNLAEQLVRDREASRKWAERASEEGLLPKKDADRARLAAAIAEAELASSETLIDTAAINSLPQGTPEEARKVLVESHAKIELDAKTKAVKAYELAESMGAVEDLPPKVVSTALAEEQGMALIASKMSVSDRKKWSQKGNREQLTTFYVRKAQYEMIPKIDQLLADNRGGLGGLWLKLHKKYGSLEEDSLDPKWDEAIKLANSGQSERARDAVKKLKGKQAGAYWKTAKHVSLIKSTQKVSFGQVALASQSKATLGSTGWGKTLASAASSSSSKVTPEPP